jgi:hypothetical protein
MINYYRSSVRTPPKQAEAALRPIKAPTLVIWGQRDRYLGPELAEPDHDDVPNLDLAAPGAGRRGPRKAFLMRLGNLGRPGTSLARNDRGQVAQRVVEMVWSERRELNVLAGNRSYRRPVIGECDLGLVWTESGQVVTPDPAAEL